MLVGLGEFDRMFPMMHDLRRRMDALWENYETQEGWTQDAPGWPRATLEDAGNAFVVRAEVPGLADKDIELTLHQDVLTLRGERKGGVPEGYQVHRRMRPTARFSRSFALPAHVDAEQVTATVRHGVLTVNMPKTPEAQPRQISVRAE